MRNACSDPPRLDILRPNRIRLLVHLARTPQAAISVREVAHVMGLSHGAAMKALVILEDAGLLEVQRNPKKRNAPLRISLSHIGRDVSENLLHMDALLRSHTA